MWQGQDWVGARHHIDAVAPPLQQPLPPLNPGVLYRAYQVNQTTFLFVQYKDNNGLLSPCNRAILCQGYNATYKSCGQPSPFIEPVNYILL
ncbi:hypothetical protein PILCRDRAFT_830529 [Piloderma croceum F 1598]|uniref:Uncharacterized protein n=1 Tax=Piloderma croceum (strain F 1598) TaxID=765440 RepID=A0A0C3ESS2_PILCF|nr:hypothetical protein PILCRDRAFT_830529 [Piloderma croceum F 1598]